jgi:hypothetical protein
MSATPKQILRHYSLPVPTTSARTLHLQMLPGSVPSVRQQCLCHRVALAKWRVAHEQSCARIVVHRDANHKHEFDTIDLMRWQVQQLGVYPVQPHRINGQVPRLLGTTAALSLGDTLDTRTHGVAVPVAITPVSGPVTGKET